MRVPDASVEMTEAEVGLLRASSGSPLGIWPSTATHGLPASMNPRVRRDRPVRDRGPAARHDELGIPRRPAALCLGRDRARDRDGRVERVAVAEGRERLAQGRRGVGGNGAGRRRRWARGRGGRRAASGCDERRDERCGEDEPRPERGARDRTDGEKRGPATRAGPRVETPVSSRSQCLGCQCLEPLRRCISGAPYLWPKPWP